MQQYQGAGTINDPSDEDEDRTVEIAFPLEGIRRPARRPVPPEAGDVADKFLPLRVSGNYHRRLTVTGSGRFGQHYSDDLEELGITRRSLSHFVWPPTLQVTITGYEVWSQEARISMTRPCQSLGADRGLAREPRSRPE